MPFKSLCKVFLQVLECSPFSEKNNSMDKIHTYRERPPPLSTLPEALNVGWLLFQFLQEGWGDAGPLFPSGAREGLQEGFSPEAI